ncbi:MAG TPA: hypothetical protein VFO85_07745 [Vicinamibacteria bacterium]|nr:hypothetical protein [Vicinamibacteria bacterium]
MAAGRRRPRAAAPRHADAALTRAARAGRARANEVIAERERVAARALAIKGVLIAEGDSWFDYPRADILDNLEDDHGWEVESVAHMGDTLESMAYDDRQLRSLAKAFEKLSASGRRPTAILLSGGGNDIAGDEFAMLLNHVRSPLDPLNAEVVAGVIDTRLLDAAVALAAGVTRLAQHWFGGATIPVLVHGYDYPVPDGRGFMGGYAFLPGPWLLPGFSQKGYADAAQRLALMRTLLDRYTAMLRRVPSAPGLGHVRYVRLLDLLGTGAGYKKWWANELHPTQAGFKKVAAEFDRILSAL